METDCGSEYTIAERDKPSCSKRKRNADIVGHTCEMIDRLKCAKFETRSNNRWGSRKRTTLTLSSGRPPTHAWSAAEDLTTVEEQEGYAIIGRIRRQRESPSGSQS